MTILTPMQASKIAGVPETQLLRWSFLDWDRHAKRATGRLGPRNSGTQHRPMYHEDDVREWRHRHDDVLLRAVEDAVR